MVRQGWFEIELINAETKVPFKEHTHTDGRTYAEVEPDTDYFIHVRSHKNKKVILKFSVDGKDLGYKKQQHQGGVWRDFGIDTVECKVIKKRFGSTNYTIVRMKSEMMSTRDIGPAA